MTSEKIVKFIIGLVVVGACLIMIGCIIAIVLAYTIAVVKGAL